MYLSLLPSSWSIDLNHAQLVTKKRKTTQQSFSEDITNKTSRSNIRSDHLLGHHHLVDEMTIHLIMLRSLMKNWIVQQYTQPFDYHNASPWVWYISSPIVYRRDRTHTSHKQYEPYHSTQRQHQAEQQQIASSSSKLLNDL